MRRRAFLAASSGSLLALAGCSGDGGKESSLDVTLEPVSYLAGAARPREIRQREVDPDDVRAEDEIPAVLREALYDALDGGFETDSVSDELLAAVDELRSPRGNHALLRPYVRLDGTLHFFEPKFPTLVVRLADETVEDGEYDPDDTITHDAVDGGHDDLSGEAEMLVERIAWDGTPNRARVPYRVSRVPEGIESFLDRYEYIEDERGVSRIEVERRHWEPPYTIEIRELGDEHRYGRPVIDEDDLGTDLRRFLRGVVSRSGDDPSPPYTTDEVPAAYFERIGTGDPRTDPFVRIDGTVYYVGVTESAHDRLPVDASIEPAPSGEDGQLQFTMTVEATDSGPDTSVAGDGPVELFSHVGLPSVLWIRHDDERHLLNSDAYEYPVDSERVTTTATDAAMLLQAGGQEFELMQAETENESTRWSLDLDVERIRETTVVEPLPVGDDLSATYDVPAAVPEGTYTARGFFGATWDDGTGTQQELYLFEVELSF